jgi:RNA polymerase sigma-70 factor (ECF subfamily)
MLNLSKLTDEEIVKIVRSKDQEAYAFLIKRYEKKLTRYASYLINDENMATDAVQESFIKAYINLNSFNLKKKFSSWIYRIVHNQALTIVGKNRQHQSIENASEIESETNLEDDLIKKELVKHAHDCLEQMPILYKEPLSLFYLEEKTYEEIGDILRISIGTVGTRINRAKIMVKKICQKKQ